MKAIQVSTDNWIPVCYVWPEYCSALNRRGRAGSSVVKSFCMSVRIGVWIPRICVNTSWLCWPSCNFSLRWWSPSTGLLETHWIKFEKNWGWLTASPWAFTLCISTHTCSHTCAPTSMQKDVYTHMHTNIHELGKEKKKEIRTHATTQANFDDIILGDK